MLTPLGTQTCSAFGRVIFGPVFNVTRYPWKARKPRVLLAFQQFWSSYVIRFMKNVHLVLRNCGIAKNWGGLSCLYTVYRFDLHAQTSGLHLWHQNAQENAHPGHFQRWSTGVFMQSGCQRLDFLKYWTRRCGKSRTVLSQSVLGPDKHTAVLQISRHL